MELEPEAPIVAPAEAVEQLTEALERSRRLLGRLTGARRSDLTEGLQDLTDAVAATLRALSDDSTPPDSTHPMSTRPTGTPPMRIIRTPPRPARPRPRTPNNGPL